MSEARERNIDQFNRDVESNSGYLYSTSDRLSCQLANARMTRAILELADLRGLRVLDIGCGEGSYSIELLDGGAAEVVGVDAAETAIGLANRRFEDRSEIQFRTVNVYQLEERGYDVAVVRGVLHHLDRVEEAIHRIAGAARRVIVVEPNGYNPVLKVIEKTSPYHVAHDEKSYAPHRLDGWFRRTGGRVTARRWVGLVPMFCPDRVARLCKATEPIAERLPLVRRVSCGQYVFRIEYG